MSVKHAFSRGLELGRSLLQLGLFKPAGRVAAKLRGERLRVTRSTRTVQPQTFLPARFRFFRRSLSRLAAQLQSAAFRRGVGGGAPRNRAVFLAFGVGLGLIEQQLEEDRTSAALCQEIQAVFRKKKFQTPLKSFTLGYKLEDYVIGKQIGKGCNAAVYEAAAQLTYNITLIHFYPCSLRQYLGVCVPNRMQASVMLLQLLEGVDHLCKQGIAHRDLKSDNVLLEFDSTRCPTLVITDFGCCLAEDLGLKLPFNSCWVNRGGNACLMAPEVATAVPGPGVMIDYSKADAWAVGAIAYELFGQPNPFYSSEGLESRTYQEQQLPPLPASVPDDVQLVVMLLLRRNTRKRPSARVAANMLHISLWGKRVLASLDRVRTDELKDWLLCQSAVVLLKGRGSGGSNVEAELQRCFLANIDLEDLRAAVSFLMYGQEQWKSLLAHYTV
uniref:non-specific serine/threonine protein kinase n=1 Tax=Sinocyclocheilus anshuiensis TaxID=1608454 RepID=A0A671N892_9TELE